MSRWGCTAFVIASLLAPTALQAATVNVTGNDPRQSITVTIKDAPVDAVLEELRKRYGFEVSGLQNTKRGGALSTTMTGNLQSVIERLLRNWNHLIVRSPDNACGIARVTIINDKYGAAPTGLGRGQAHREQQEKQMQALTGAMNF